MEQQKLLCLIFLQSFIYYYYYTQFPQMLSLRDAENTQHLLDAEYSKSSEVA